MSHTYALRTWERADAVWEGIVLDNEEGVRLYRHCCSLEDCPSATKFGDEPMTEEEARNWVSQGRGDSWALLHDEASREGLEIE